MNLTSITFKWTTKLYLIVVLYLCSSSVRAEEYFVATNGSDTNAGTSISEPFRTIQAAADVMISGDTCFIRGGTYRETVTPANSGTAANPITFMPYNSESVTMSGADVVTGWSLYSNSIYRATMDWDLGEGFNQIFVDGLMINRARWPNTGADLLSPTTASGSAANSEVTFSVARPTDYWAGATVYGLFGPKWTSQGATISASTSGGALTVTDKTNPWYTGSGKGYITGIFGELDSENEWFLVGTTLYLWAPGSVNPSTLTVEAKARKWCVNLSGRSYVNVKNIDMFAGSIRMDSDNCEISGCDVKYLSHFTKYTWGGMDAGGNRRAGDNGVYLNGSENVISNCTFTFSAGSGILVYGSSNTITRCVISEMDYSATYSCPMSIKGSTGGNQILFNTMYNTARDVLQLYGSTADTIKYNDMYNAGKMCHDLGITYQWGRDGQGTVIAYNWIHDNKAPGTNPGIYNDNYCRNFIEHHNVIWNCEAGIRLNGPHDAMQVYNNTLFNCDDVGTHTYNQYPNYMPSYWSSGGYGNIMDSSRSNNLFLGTNPASQLLDYANYDFRLKTGAAAIDSGVEVPPYTDGWYGSAPDKGAYEDGRSQWTAGHNGVALMPPHPPNLPGIRTDPASDVLFNSATINGTLTTTGAAPAAVWAFWGDDNATQVQTNWDQQVSFGTNSFGAPHVYSTNLASLVEGTTYYYRYYVTNAYGDSWGDVETFTPSSTQSVTLAVSVDLDILPAGTKRTTEAALQAGCKENSAGQDRRVFLKYDLSAVQTNWTIHSAIIRLYHLEGQGDTSGAADLYQVADEWTSSSITYLHPVGTNLGNLVGSSGPFNEFKEMDVKSIIQGWQSDTNSHHGFSIRGTETYTQTGKYFVSSEGPEGQRPELVIVYSVPDADGYSAWAADYGLTGNDALRSADVENGGIGDGYDNLLEFALGMNPTISDAGSRESIGTVSDGGTNWFEYVYYRRTNYVEEGLSYLLMDSTNLMESFSSTNAQDHILVGPAVDGYEAVANRYLADDPAKFIKFDLLQE